MLETIEPATVSILMGQALNKRLGTEHLTIKELAVEAAKKNMTLEEVMAIPEQDFWEYEGI